MNFFKKVDYYKEIVNYYHSSQVFYRLFFYNSYSLGMHTGFWYRDTKNLHEAILNSNQEIIDIANVKKDQKLLDAGCGVGGSAIYIAKKTGAKVFGITLAQNQVKLAKYYAKKHKVEKLTDFRVQSYEKINFPDNFFDVVYGIESICYAYPKARFLKEAYRVLKPGGKLVVIDGYLDRKPIDEKEEKVIKGFVKSFSIREMITPVKMSQDILKAKFIKIKSKDMTTFIKPSTDYLFNLSLVLWPLAKISSFLPFSFFQGFSRNITACICMGKEVRSGLASYYVHFAKKA